MRQLKEDEEMKKEYECEERKKENFLRALAVKADTKKKEEKDLHKDLL